MCYIFLFVNFIFIFEYLNEETVTQKIIKGITWDHSRGYVPMIATAQRFMEKYPDVKITWEKRSLQDFADKPIGLLAAEYDLLVIDHPWIGYGAEENKFLALDNYLPPAFLEDQKVNSVGRSFESYTYNNKLWSLPIDAATPVASYRPDLMQKKHCSLPTTFDEVLKMAEKGYVILPGIAIDTLMNFFMFCVSLGEAPFTEKEVVISEKTGLEALALYKSLTDKVDPLCFDLNPIKTYEQMAASDDYLYCPFAYGYVNYAWQGYADNRLEFTDLVKLKDTSDQPLSSTLGGTGLAIAAHCQEKEIAIQYIEYVASAGCQQNLYINSGGQPAHLKAWQNRAANQSTGQYFNATLPALQRAYLRPRHNGYIHFQDQAGKFIRDYLRTGGSAHNLLQQLNHLQNKAF